MMNTPFTLTESFLNTLQGNQGMIEYKIAFPQCRWVTEDRIQTWYADAVANGEAEVVGLTNIREIMDELEGTGQVTFTTEERITK